MNKILFETEYIACSDWTMRHLGNGISYKKKSRNKSLTNMVIENKIKILYDQKYNAHSGTIFLKEVPVLYNNTVIYLNNFNISCVINTPTGSNKNIDSILYHGLDIKNILKENIKVYFSFNKIEKYEIISGIEIVLLDNNAFIIKTDYSGIIIEYNNNYNITNENAFYKIIITSNTILKDKIKLLKNILK